MRRSGMWSLALTVVLTITALTASILAGNGVLLGLDLQGGAEVVLEPVDDTPLSGGQLDEALDQSVEIIRNRVDGLGVAEPDITRQGDRVVVQLPGVEDQQRALEVVGQTAELRFRPVCNVAGLDGAVPDIEDLPPPEEPTEEPAGTVEPTEEPTDGPAATVEPTEEPSDDGADEQGLAGIRSVRRQEPTTEPTADATTEPTAAPAPTEAPTEGVAPDTPLDLPDEADLAELGLDGRGCTAIEETTPEEDDPDKRVVLQEVDEDGNPAGLPLELGATMLTGTALEGASSGLGGQFGTEWEVRPTFRSGEDGIDLFNEAASECFNQTATCPTGQLAIVLDGVIVSAPSINTPFFERDRIVISGAFNEARADDTALVLRYGALPLEFKDPATGGFVRSVSATVGKDSLRAGAIAGIIGLILVGLYMVAYYRLLGLAALTSLAVSGTWLWIILAYLSSNRSLALTLAGVVGLIVSIGTSLDTNVVYFEHLKEDILNGRTLRSSVDRSFPVAYRTILFANSASIIGSVILYLLTVGSVRGFALMLGLASVLDLLATYFFLRPLVSLMARSDAVVERPGLFGLPGAPEAGSSS